MAIVVWDGSLATGIDVIDRQHERLFAVINSLHEKMHTHADQTSLLTTVDSMRQYAKYHFTTEERLLEEHGFADLEAHRAEHLEFEEKTAELFQKTGEIELTEAFYEALTYLLNWIVRHVGDTDQRYTSFLKERLPSR